MNFIFLSQKTMKNTSPPHPEDAAVKKKSSDNWGKKNRCFWTWVDKMEKSCFNSEKIKNLYIWIGLKAFLASKNTLKFQNMIVHPISYSEGKVVCHPSSSEDADYKEWHLYEYEWYPMDLKKLSRLDWVLQFY